MRLDAKTLWSNDNLWEREREISAFVALICLQQRKLFIVIKALSDLAGGDSGDSNEADTY